MSNAAEGDFLATLVTDALTVAIPLEPVAADQIPALDAAGNPQTGAVALGNFAGREFGVWEMTVGAMTDTEVDELCVIISGAGEVHRTIDDVLVIEPLRPGTVLQLREGEGTLWVITETLRKVYLA